MANTLNSNLIITRLLHMQSDRGDYLRGEWERFSEQDKEVIFHFLYNCGQHHLFLSLLKKEIQSNAIFVPWTHVFSLLIKSEVIDDNGINELLSIIEDSSQLGLFRLPHEKLEKLWKERRAKVSKDFASKKEELLGVLDFSQQQGLLGKKQKVLGELHELFGDDHDVKRLIEKEKEFAALQTLQKAKSKSLDHETRTLRSPISQEDTKELRLKAIKLAKKNPSLAHDISIAFYQMDLFSIALEILDLKKEKTEKDHWAEVMVALEAGQWARALASCQTLEANFSLKGKKVFSVLYYQALCLKGLGQDRLATSILRRIVKIEPHFKIASSLLIDWDKR